MEEISKIKTPRFAQMLTTLFVGLKIVEEIDWNWLIVVSPILAVGVINVLIDFYNKYREDQ